MLIKTILNNVHPLNHFVYHSDFLIKNSDGSLKEIQVLIHPRSNSKAICSICNKRAPVYAATFRQNVLFVSLNKN